MKKWMQKFLVVSVALLTFGVINPNHEIWNNFEDELKPNRLQEPSANDISSAIQLDTLLYEENISIAQSLKGAAKTQSYIKFGPRIAEKIGDEFETRIFPKMEEAIDMTLARLDDDKIPYLTITENPSGDYAERIFNIREQGEKVDLIRFHVRTENRPNEGYYYNFHYHTKEDSFVAHYNLGEIYWSKNTPPKWLA
ncbi:YpjP family protein [Bacillus ndiopicus]|uniref:YpjP family protein n=1 Tax=Bacillus ndiopicus TaxID=1347368 RepID=UPI0005A7C1C0|nr:YpjP family protein [Bacillus ndiopicus]